MWTTLEDGKESVETEIREYGVYGGNFVETKSKNK